MSRKRNHTRLLAAALAVAALSLPFAGCGSGDPEATDVTAAGGTAAATSGSTSPDQPGKPSSPPLSKKPPNPVAGLPTADQIDYAIKAVLASAVPSLACAQASTANYVKTTFGGVKGCRKSTLPASAATSVIVTAVKVKGSAASATARPSGGPSDGETINVKLVREKGVWKVDSLHSNAPVGP